MKKYNFYRLNHPNKTILIHFRLGPKNMTYCGRTTNCRFCAIESWCDLGSNEMFGCEIIAQTNVKKYLILIAEDKS